MIPQQSITIDLEAINPDPGRPFPPELMFLFGNKTKHELEIEECMVEFAECVAIKAFR